MSFLVDTDICSAHLRQRGIVSNRFLQYTGGLYLSTVSLGELCAWAFRSNAPPQRLEGLRALLDDVHILDVTHEIAERFGKEQAKLLDAGRPAPGLDLMIAATALHHDLTLVTHNIQDFEDIPGLRIVDWTLT